MRRRHRGVIRVLAAIVTVSVAGCGSPSAASPAGGGGAAGSAGGSGASALSDAEIEQLAATYPTFQKVNAKPFVTQQHQGNPMVNVYANAIAADTYKAVLPSSTSAHFAQGSMLVKEMLDASGGPPILTVMYKLPAGYDSANGDWWRGRLNADGSATAPDLVGKVGFCLSCHSAAKATDAAFGLPPP